jgi:ribokinase
MMDLVMRVARRPRRGETVFGTDFGMFLGGKGFNQAIAARRLGADVAMIGRIGDDDFGRQLQAALRDAGVDHAGLVTDPRIGTGVAAPVIEANGDNSIISVPRANMQLAAADVQRSAALFPRARAVLLQMEVPADASLAAARLAREAGARVLLNTAPAGPVPKDLLAAADLLVANESEAATLTGVPVRTVEDAFKAAPRLRGRSDQTVVVTLGAAGAVVEAGSLRRHVPAFPVPARDTTGAGDAFCAALAVRLTETDDLLEALAWANAAGACAVTVLGAEPSLPERAMVEGVVRSAQRSGQ